jgi:hypothetical protein
MDYIQKVMKSIRGLRFGKLETDANLEYASYAVFGMSLLYILYSGQLATIGMALGVAMVLFVVTGNNIAIALISGALVGLIALYYSRRKAEGFKNEEKEEDEHKADKKKPEEEHKDARKKDERANEHKTEKKEKFSGSDDEEEEADEEGYADEEEEDVEEGFMGFEVAPSYGNFNGEPESLEGFANPKPRRRKAKKAAPPPDNGDRAEMFELGKKYKMPSEEDDKEFHLDAGTTFMNAYKSLKPDQIAAMTKDTQELMDTQKQLMSTLNTLKPLIQDGKEMMNMFQGYFGSGSPTTN